METVLVVDDNKQITGFVAGSLLPSLGYQTIVAGDGKSALEIIHNNSHYIDLMLLDLQLPDVSGLDILRQLSQEGLSIPAILFTGHGSEQIAVEAFRLGVHDYLTKPVDVDVLGKTINRVLATSRLRKETDTLNMQLREQVNWLTVLTKVGKIITSTLDADTVFKRIVEAGVLLTKAEEGFLALLDPSDGQLFLRAVKNIDEDRIKTLRLPVTDSVSGMVLKTGQPLRSTPNERKPLKVSTGFLVHSLLHVPLISKGVSLGVLSVDNRTNNRSFSAMDEAMLVSLADYAAVALENAHLFDQAQEEIHERKRAEIALRESEERYALAVRGANDGVWDWDLVRQSVYYSPRWKEMLGFDNGEIGTSTEEWFKRVFPEDREQMMKNLNAHLQGLTPHFEHEHRMLHKDGNYRWVMSRGLAFRDEQQVAIRMAGSQTDITGRKVAEQRLLYDARHDALTGLWNRASLLERLKLAMERVKRRPNYLYAVIFLDLDRFKDVNDSLGHMMGDLLVISTAKVLNTILRPTDCVARLGGDEFVILLEDINDINAATRVADRIQAELSNTILLPGHNLFVTASMGIVLSTSGYTNPEDILRDADIAMYRAKALGRARFEIFDPEMRDRIMERLTLETELRQALEKNEFRLQYQPIVTSDSFELLGFEALVRWQNPQRGYLAPLKFLGVAEETGLIISIDRWVMREACRQMCEWQEKIPDLPPLKISVNLSGKQVSQPDLLDFIDLVLTETGLAPERLNLEITETVVMESILQTAQVLAKLQDRGLQIQIDDFGVGYSSLSYLSRFPLNALKIDRSFIKTMGQDEANLRIVQAVVNMTHGLGIHVVAEGVETPEQLNQLKDIGCEFIQGYLVSKPMDVDDTLSMLERVYNSNRGPLTGSLAS